jgi:hypothetical protein
MSLENLKLDRFLQRNANTSTISPFQGIDAGVPDGESYESGGGPGGGLSGDTGGITGQPGGIIAQMFLRSSNGPDRVEINPNDTFIAYDNNVPVITINKNGINVQGANLPQVFTGSIDSTGAALYLPTGWSCVRNGLGDYTITHNFNVNIWYSVVLTPITGHFRGKIVSFGPTSFNVTFQESVYAAGLYTGETLVDTDFNFIVANVL